jgi:uncharacterized SAM-binding protein YcdF (DUF218 family)
LAEIPGGGRGPARKSLRALVVIGGALVVAWVIAAALLFGFPDQQVPAHADAVVVLAGGRGPRLERGLELMERKVAPVLVISDGWDPLWPEANRLCGGRPVGFRVICFRPEPYSTRGEARGVSRLASALDWKRVVVVTSTYHLFRARMLFDRCLQARVDGAGADYSLGQVPYTFASETVKLALSLAVKRGC